MTSDLKVQTIQDFGEQWTAFRDNPGYYGSSELLADLLGPLLRAEAVKGARVADIGSGTGRIVNMLLDCGATHVYALEPSAAMDVLKENTVSRRQNVTYLQGAGESLPPALDLDVIVSIGVLHHIPDPAPVLRAAFGALKPGGILVVWLYGREGNHTYLRVIEPLRRVTTKIPHRVLVGISAAMGWCLDGYIAACRVLPLPMRAYMREVLAKFPRRIRRLTIYDQLNPAYAKYYTRDEALALLADQGFVEVNAYHRHGYSWTVAGRRPD